MKPLKPSDITLASLHAHDAQGKMHPDNMPWAKSCRDVRWYKQVIDCAYLDGRMRNEFAYTSTNPFPCWHRTEGGFYRICAGWVACHRRKSC
jgi:hypothetical protein